MFNSARISKLLSSCSHLYRHCGKGIYRRPDYLWPQLSYYSVQVENRIDDKLLSLKWEDGKVTEYPHIYLRDNCPCPSCYNPQTRQRVISNLIFDDYANATIKSAHVDQDKDELHVEWTNDGQHESSIYQLDWLKDRRFASQAESQQVRINRNLWDSDTQNNLQRFDYNELIENKSQLYQWLRSILDHGIAIIDKVPDETSQVRKLANQVSYLRPSCYGDVFRIESLGEAATTIGYQTGRLAMHSDLAYYANMPGILILHCLVAANKGGENLFSDGFKAAQRLRETHPEYFDLLVKYPLQHEDIGRVDYDFHQMALHPVIRLYHNGEIKQVCYGDHSRTSMLHIPYDDVPNYYKALQQFLEYVYSRGTLIQFKLHPGSMVTIDNYRIFHGRTAFDSSANNRRCIEGGYLDWDEATSFMRIMEKELNMNHLTPSM